MIPDKMRNVDYHYWLQETVATVGNEQREKLKRSRPLPQQNIVEVASREEAGLVEELGVVDSLRVKLDFAHGFKAPRDSLGGGSYCCGLRMCDFNSFLTSDDKSKGNNRNGASDSFRNFIDKFHVEALDFQGPRMTYNNNRPGHRNVQERLDWLFANKPLLDSYPKAFLNHLDFFGSDHRAINLKFDNPPPHLSKAQEDRLFPFKNVLLIEPNLDEVILKAWSPSFSYSFPIQNLASIQEACADHLPN
uniref:Uncharacterized protein n=1 Tax=Cannabis sativa TaxID=3483 RepID=A0A803P5N3_CANSA